MKGAATAAAAQGEIVQVDGGGQILRATGRKDRHSKVYTAKGPRDRRVRLSAHTAIQFYDVQDRLGYDRPSKAVDWLIRKARAAIDRLNDPPQQPTPESNPSSADPGQSSLEQQQQQAQVLSQYDFRPGSSSNNNNNNNNNNASYMGGADLMSTMKSLFPTSTFAGFDNDPCQAPSFPARDLGLSLQTLQADGGGNPDNPFQGNFHWGGGGGFSQFSHQRELLQSNAAAAASLWNQRPLIPANNHDHEQPRFELGFRVPARIYGEEEAAENHR